MEPTVILTTSIIKDDPVIDPSLEPSTILIKKSNLRSGNVKDDVPNLTILLSTNVIQDEPNASPVPSVSWNYGENPINFTVQPTIAP